MFESGHWLKDINEFGLEGERALIGDLKGLPWVCMLCSTTDLHQRVRSF